ncbi:P-loop containing nucleoside triphosphate hydrolase protein [Aspergillus lucknowensis]|uniref:P-loop containing nucleoside triphosphate hydrolase protein n=1 Tax=Aspergillus lucknowensis TaxID=176173 RepID=A0ABR4M532_9EURO
MADPSDFCARIDNSWRVYAQSCRGGFDFTLLFEELALCILPISLAIILSPLRIYSLLPTSSKVESSKRPIFKTSGWLLWSALQFLQAILWALPNARKTRASIAANLLMGCGAVILCVLSYMEHSRSVRPSMLLELYLQVTLLCDITRTRTLWLRDGGDSNKLMAIIASFAVGVKVVLILLEGWQKRAILNDKYRNYPPEAVAGIANRAFFWWLNPLFFMGFFKLLRVEDLYPLDKRLESARLRDKLDGRWTKENQTGQASLLAVVFKTFKWSILAVVPPRLCLIGLTFCQPLLLHKAMELSAEKVTLESTHVGYGLIGAYILVYVGMAIMMSQQQHLTYRAIAMVRGAVVSMIYKKASMLTIKDADPAASMTLMSADIERIVQGWQTMHEIWANATEIALAIVLLEKQLGIACAVPVGVAIFALVCSLVAMSGVMARQAKWLEAIERRISSTAAMLASIKGAKLLGLKPSLMSSIQKLRLEELTISKAFRKLLVWNMAFAWMTRIFAPIVSFAAFVAISENAGRGSSLDINMVYTSLSLFALLADPFLSLVMALMGFLGSIGSFARIQEFLNKETHHGNPEAARWSSVTSLTTRKERHFSSDTSSTITVSDDTAPVEMKFALPFLDILMVQGASFGWDPKADPILQDITLTFPGRSFSMIVGPSGSGKSTLLKALLGEVPCLEGKVKLSSDSIAYCDQTPWHMNGTIRESITAMSEFDLLWYTTVIRACALEQDLAQWPQGDQAVIGSRGVALSGGQSQRIALARAIYARKRILILDDVFSGLDAATENHIFCSLLGVTGLLREAGTTVVLASSSVKRLPYADHIVVLDEEGRLTESGSFGDLAERSGYVSSFSLPAPNWDSTAEAEFVPKSKPSRTEVMPVKKEDWSEENVHKHTGSFATYLFYIRAVGWIPTIIFLTAIAGFVFCISFPSIWLKWWVAADAKEPGEHTQHYVGIYFMLGGLAMVCLIVSCWDVVVTSVPKSGERFHEALLDTVLSAPMRFLSTTDSGSILNRFSQDLQLIDMELPIAAINVVATFFLCMAQMILVGVASVYAAIAFPVVLISLYAIQKVYLRTSRQLRLLEIEAKAPLLSHFTDCLSGLVTLRAFGWQDAMEEKNVKILDYSQRPFYSMYSAQRWLTLTLDLVVAGIAIVLIILVVALRGSLNAAYVGVALFNVILFSQTVKLLVQFWTNMETHIGSVVRVKDFTEKVEREDLPSENDPVPPLWPSQGAIEFANVSASYGPSDLVLKDVSLTIRPGEKVGICGRTGSGKTSLMLSIFRMIELNAGTISIDGLDISRIPRQEIRSRLNGVSQDAVFIKGSVRLNADPTGASSDRAIWDALKSVQLLTVVQEKGGLTANIDDLHLSHGQKQLFCLVRAILHPSKILVLDEATSNVDSKTDQTMQRIIREKFSNHTILAVAHKLDTILDYDKVVVLDAGQVIECEDPYTLLNRDSAFSKLYANSLASEDEQRI